MACVAAAIVVGMALRWPSLDFGFTSDDYVEAAMLEGQYASPRHKVDLFNFADGSASDNTRLLRYGSLPWWSVNGLRLSMMRPLSSLLVVLDHQLFGRHERLYHVHSFVWWVLLMIVAARLFRELFPMPVAAVAIAIFALEEGHLLPLGWLANRGALVAMVFGLLGLLVHVRARRSGRMLGLLGSAACFSIALLSGEWAFPLLGYALAYELFGDARDRSLRARALGLLPSALPGIVFLLARSRLGYGVLYSGVYIDPVTEPVTFFRAACQRIPVFFADLFFSVPANWWGLGTPWRDRILSWHLFPPHVWVALPGWRFWHIALGVFSMIATFFTLRAGLRDRAGERTHIRWMLIGALISLVPMAASFPTSRLVLPASIAASAAAALIILGGQSRFRALWPTARLRALLPLSIALAVCYFQVWEAGATSYFETRVASYGYASVRDWIENAQIDDREVAEQRVVLLNSVEHTSMMFGPYMRWFYQHPKPKAWWLLSATPHAHDVYRPARNVLELSVLGGTMLMSDIETLYRADRFPIRPGYTVQIPGLTVQVLRVVAGKPQTVRYTFADDLDDPRYLFLSSNPEGLVRARLPEVGQRIRYRRASFPNRDLAQSLRNLRDPNTSCPRFAPAIEDCRVGGFFADCGGAGEPVFACHGLGDCRWFSGGCVAEGYGGSSCSAHALECEQGFPFASDAWISVAPYRELVREHVQSWGEAPWDGVHELNVDVAVVPGLPSQTPMIVCTGPDSERGPCDSANVELPQPLSLSLSFSFLPSHPAPGWFLSVEVIDTRAGELRARVCKVELPEQGLSSADAAAPRPSVRPRCATTGTLTLNRAPADASHILRFAARLRADFADGLHVEAEL